MILNHITRKIDLAYDAEGKMARFVEEVAPIVDGTDDRVENQLHTAVHHICEKVAQQVKLNSQNDNSLLFVTGGGALNDFLIETLQEKLGESVKVTVPEKVLIEFKEAVVFALMGALRVEKQINVLKSVTGAKRDSSSGVIYHPA